MKDLANHIEVRRAISPAAATTDNTAFVSQIIDIAGFSSLVFALLLGSIADADVTFTALVEHGDDPALGDATAVPDAQLTGTEAGLAPLFSDDNKTKKIGYVGSKRYVRLTVTPAANSGNIFLAAVAILSDARYGLLTAQTV